MVTMVRFFILERVKPKDFDEKEFDRLRRFWGGDEENMLERLLQEWMKQHLHYLHWYASAYFDYSLSLEYLLSGCLLDIQTQCEGT